MVKRLLCRAFSLEIPGDFHPKGRYAPNSRSYWGSPANQPGSLSGRATRPDPDTVCRGSIFFVGSEEVYPDTSDVSAKWRMVRRTVRVHPGTCHVSVSRRMFE